MKFSFDIRVMILSQDLPYQTNPETAEYSFLMDMIAIITKENLETMPLHKDARNLILYMGNEHIDARLTYERESVSGLFEVVGQIIATS